VRYNTRPCIRRLIRFGSGKAGIAAMAKPYRSKEAGAAPLQEQCHAAMSIKALNLNGILIKLTRCQCATAATKAQLIT